MSVIQACILGIIQGITEFLPVSSTAHLIVLPRYLGLNVHQDRAIDVFLNVGTLCAIMLFFYKDVAKLFVGFYDTISRKKSNNRRFFITLFLASLPTIIVGGIAELIFDIDPRSELLLGINSILFGLVLYFCDRFPVQNKFISRKHAVLVGFAQTLALIPGVSRLGACLSLARYLKYERWEAFKFSMLLSMPAVTGACIIKFIKVLSGKITIDSWTILPGITCALLFGLVTLWLIRIFLKKHTFRPFAIYRILLGLMTASLIQ